MASIEQQAKGGKSADVRYLTPLDIDTKKEEKDWRVKKKGIKDVLVVGGGVIPEIDHKDLIKSGVDHVFGPGTPLPTIIDHINTGVAKLRKL